MLEQMCSPRQCCRRRVLAFSAFFSLPKIPPPFPALPGARALPVEQVGFCPGVDVARANVRGSAVPFTGMEHPGPSLLCTELEHKL